MKFTYQVGFNKMRFTAGCSFVTGYMFINISSTHIVINNILHSTHSNKYKIIYTNMFCKCKIIRIYRTITYFGSQHSFSLPPYNA